MPIALQTPSPPSPSKDHIVRKRKQKRASEQEQEQEHNEYGGGYGGQLNPPQPQTQNVSQTKTKDIDLGQRSQQSPKPSPITSTVPVYDAIVATEDEDDEFASSTSNEPVPHFDPELISNADVKGKRESAENSYSTSTINTDTEEDEVLIDLATDTVRVSSSASKSETLDYTEDDLIIVDDPYQEPDQEPDIENLTSTSTSTSTVSDTTDQLYSLAAVAPVEKNHSSAMLNDLQHELAQQQQLLATLQSQRAKLEAGIHFQSRYWPLESPEEDEQVIKELRRLDPEVQRYFEKYLGKDTTNLNLIDEALDTEGEPVSLQDSSKVTLIKSGGVAEVTYSSSEGSTVFKHQHRKGWLGEWVARQPSENWVVKVFGLRWITSKPRNSMIVSIISLLLAFLLIFPPLISTLGGGGGGGGRPDAVGTPTVGFVLSAGTGQNDHVAASVAAAAAASQATVTALSVQNTQLSITQQALLTVMATTPTPRPNQTITTAAAAALPTATPDTNWSARNNKLAPSTIAIPAINWSNTSIVRFVAGAVKPDGGIDLVEAPEKGKLYQYGSFPGEGINNVGQQIGPANTTLFGNYEELGQVVERLQINDTIQLTDRSGGLYVFRVLRWSDFDVVMSSSSKESAEAKPTPTLTIASASPSPVSSTVTLAVPTSPTPTPTLTVGGQFLTATALASYGFGPPDFLTTSDDLSLVALPVQNISILTLVSLPQTTSTTDSTNKSPIVSSSSSNNKNMQPQPVVTGKETAMPMPNSNLRRAIRAKFVSYTPAKPVAQGTPVIPIVTTPTSSIPASITPTIGK